MQELLLNFPPLILSGLHLECVYMCVCVSYANYSKRCTSLMDTQPSCCCDDILPNGANEPKRGGLKRVGKYPPQMFWFIICPSISRSVFPYIALLCEFSVRFSCSVEEQGAPTSSSSSHCPSFLLLIIPVFLLTLQKGVFSAKSPGLMLCWKRRLLYVCQTLWNYV